MACKRPRERAAWVLSWVVEQLPPLSPRLPSSACRVVSGWAGETKPPAALSGRCKDGAVLCPSDQLSTEYSAVPGRTL